MNLKSLSKWQRSRLEERTKNDDERTLWANLFRNFDLNDAQFEMSLQYIEHDRIYRKCMTELDQKGMTTVTADGNDKPSPVMAMMRAAGSDARKILKQIESHAKKAPAVKPKIEIS